MATDARPVQPEAARSSRPVRAGRGPLQRRQRRLFAAIDLGTNNCRLLIAQPTREGFHVVDAFSRVVRLGEKLAVTGVLSEAAQDRALAALRVCASKLRRHEVSVMRSVTTEACRRASNSAAFIARVYADTGLALDVISCAEEARLAVLGCQALIDPNGGPALIFDVGGGSTEIILVEPDQRGQMRTRHWTSLPWGVVSLAETEPVEPATPEARLASFLQMRARVAADLAPFRTKVAGHVGGQLQLLGTSGTITTLAALHLELPCYDRNRVDGCFVPAASMRSLSGRLARMTSSERAQVPSIGVERADLVVAGCALLDAILDAWPVDLLRVADRGIREGILRTLMARDHVGRGG
jgi:exopolyphosphatase/guanosine-5'-triphosphate,3'-diphosphate pyrophosphatase